MTADEALERLRAGNARFVAGERVERDLRAEAAACIDAQTPFAAVLACADSRVAPEHVFDAGIGELFVARVAGNVVDDDVLGSLEYAVQALAVELVVVLGHTGCGAVAAANAGVKLGALTGALERIGSATVEENVERSVQELATLGVRVVGATQSLASGEVVGLG